MHSTYVIAIQIRMIVKVLYRQYDRYGLFMDLKIVKNTSKEEVHNRDATT